MVRLSIVRFAPATLNLEPFSHHLKLPDLWQHAAVNHLRAGSDVIVSAPTGAGKTFVFELLVQSGHLKRQAVYTVPTRALANDKYAEWKDAGWNVGLATGDLSENVHAPVLVATLETQIERLLTRDGPEILVMDEFQMIADPARGSHYEGAIILAPPQTRLLLLSGSVENPNDVADWMRRLGRKVEVVATRERPVPLEEMPIEVLPQKMRGIEGYWPKLAASALLADLAPLLIFAPRRKDAESIAHKLSTHLPQGEPLSLTAEQKALAGRDFASLLEKRIAYHHSGLSYAIRAGLVEPLAKAGQLRVIVSTMGLAAGINFSVRSVHVSSTIYHDGITEQQLGSDELLQMFGRAGRRGLDERGYVLTTRESPSLADARAARLRRTTRLSWPLFIRVMRHAALDGREPFAAATEFAGRLFAKSPPELGLETSSAVAPEKKNVSTMFGLKGTKHELLNSEGKWEERKGHQTSQVALGETWYARADFQGPALSSTNFVGSLAANLGRLFKLERTSKFQLYGKEIALGQIKIGENIVESEGDAKDGTTNEIIPTQALRKLLQIPKHVVSLTPEKIEKVAIPKLAAIFEGANFLDLVAKGDLLWARFDFSTKLVEATADVSGRLLVEPLERVAERDSETEIRLPDNKTSQPRGGTAIHSWRSLGLIENNGAPTQRGVIFSFFQHGEGLAIAAALEDETYSVEELLHHLANLRSDCHFDQPEAGGSERLSAHCRATFGFVNYVGYLEAGLPVGYGEGTAELLGLVEGGTASAPRIWNHEVAEGDLARAYIEWLSLLRHITHAPENDWERWISLKKAAAVLLEKHLAATRLTLHPKLPKLTPKQKHERPRHYLIRNHQM